MAYIKGNFKKYIYKSDNGFTVGLFNIKETNIDYDSKTIIFTGHFPLLNELDLYKFEGELVFHDKYGEQFSVSSFEIVLPDDNDNIVSFLSSEIFKGIGASKAKKIVNSLGDNCLNEILDNPDVLDRVNGVTAKQKDTIYNCLLEYRSSYDRMLKITGYGFSVKNAIKIEKFYGADTSYMLEHPYQIIDDIPDITFPIVDKLKSKFNISDDDIDRTSFGLVYIIENLEFSTGNTYFSYNEIAKAAKVLNINSDVLNDAISHLVGEGKIIIDDDKYILTKTYEASTYIAKRILDLSKNTRLEDFSEQISLVEKRNSITFNKEQKDAITNALNNNFSVITGGPGTGKTTIIKAITSIYKDIYDLSRKELNESLVLLAPTGRASKRMSENAHLPSYTIHRFLKWDKDSNSFYVNEENKSEAKIVIIDEASMVDENLLYNLFLGLSSSCKIIMIGDYNQLPSVGAGQVLKDVIESESTIVTYLETLYRQDEKSNINFFAKDIVDGKIDFSLFNESEDLTFIPCDENNLKSTLHEFLDAYKDLSIYDFQILAPMYKGLCGIDNLNIFCQKLLNNNSLKIQIKHGETTFLEDDKVLCLVNNIDSNVFNGDIGEIINIKTTGKKEIICDFDDNILELETSSFDDIRLGYVISIHKAQGSEFDVVVLPVLKSYNYMLYRKIFYTAVTRAKKKLIILGEEEALKKAISTNRDENRKTLLKNFLINGINF